HMPPLAAVLNVIASAEQPPSLATTPGAFVEATLAVVAEALVLLLSHARAARGPARRTGAAHVQTRSRRARSGNDFMDRTSRKVRKPVDRSGPHAGIIGRPVKSLSPTLGAGVRRVKRIPAQTRA